jgi:hypothetical protein
MIIIGRYVIGIARRVIDVCTVLMIIKKMRKYRIVLLLSHHFPDKYKISDIDPISK